ncbi:MAG: serine/threonine protein kinase [Planctomycetia bacterium]|nr:MAG: serine/threonine protein kinase [Planctomycetia bacterium]
MNPLQETVTVVMDAAPGTGGQSITLPRRIGTVKIGDCIGRGGSGVVFSGYDDALKRSVAVKILHHLRGGARELDRGRLIDGVRNAARVRHEHLVMVHGVDLVGDFPVIVMEHVDGASLRDLLSARGQFDVETALHLAREVCAGVDALHRENIVHRDLKPANVLIDRGGVARVCDFGLACEVGGTAMARSDENVAGSPLFMAPEVFEGMVSPQGDVYAVGVLLFEMLAGRVPFDGDSIADVRDRHLHTDPPIDILAGAGVPDDLVELVGRCLNKQRIMRYKSAGHLLRALEEMPPRQRPDHVRARVADGVNSLGPGAKRAEADRTPTPVAANTYDMLSARAAAKRKHKPE